MEGSFGEINGNDSVHQFCRLNTENHFPKTYDLKFDFANKVKGIYDVFFNYQYTII